MIWLQVNLVLTNIDDYYAVIVFTTPVCNQIFFFINFFLVVKTKIVKICFLLNLLDLRFKILIELLLRCHNNWRYLETKKYRNVFTTCLHLSEPVFDQLPLLWVFDRVIIERHFIKAKYEFFNLIFWLLLLPLLRCLKSC